MSEDVSILFPDETVTVQTPQGEETVTVREFRFGQSAKAFPLARPMLADFAELAVDAAGGELSPLFELQAKHWDAFVELVAMSVDRPRAWVEALPDEAGQRIALAFWRVQGPFFVRRLATEIETLRSLFDSQMSSMSSSEPATAATLKSSPSA